MSLVNTKVAPFKAQAFHNGKFIEVSEQSLQGQWSAFIFMPAAFTFNCPTEVEDAADNYAEFQKLGTQVYIITTDLTSHTRCGSRPRRLSAKPASRWWATLRTS